MKLNMQLDVECCPHWLVKLDSGVIGQLIPDQLDLSGIVVDTKELD